MSGEERLDPRTAAALIAQTEQETRRSLLVDAVADGGGFLVAVAHVATTRRRG